MLRDAPGNVGGPAAYGPPNSVSPNYFQMLWQRKLLIVLGTVVGASIGFWHNSKQPSVYRSTAKFQLVEPHTKAIPVQGVEAQPFGDGTEQAMIMRSETILTRAAELGKLDEVPPFLGLPANQIGPMLSVSTDFTVKPLGRTTYQIGYVANSPDTPLRVLQAVTDAYREHLTEQQNLVGKETLSLIEEARGEVLERLESLEEQFDKFKRSTPLVYRNGEMSSIHREYADRYLSQRQELVMARTQIDSKLKAAKDAIDAGEDLQSILLLLSGDVRDAMVDVMPRRAGNVEESGEVEATQIEAEQDLIVPMSRADTVRNETLFPLELQEQELLREVGQNHPSVRSLRSKMRMIQAQIKQIEESETVYNQRMRELIEKQREQAKLAVGVTPSDDEERALIQERQKEQIRLLVLAMQQNRKLIDHELEVIKEAYDYETSAMADERAAEIEHDRMSREIARQQGLYDRIVARLDEISITAESGGIRIVPLALPRLGNKVTVIQSRSLMLGALLGFGSMVALCLLLGISDKSYHSAEQIAEHLNSPVIGHIPFISGTKFRSKLAARDDSDLDQVLHTHHNPKNSASEAYKSIRTALFFSDQGGKRNVLQVTSAAPSEGKSTIASNIAITIAQTGKSVLLIDADLRRPRLAKLFNIDSEKGLAWAVESLDQGTGFDVLGEAVHETEVANLTVLPAGTKPDNPAELLTSTSFEKLLDLVREKFDIVILDSPPLLAVTDPSNIAPRVDGVIMVVRLGKQTRPRAAQANRMLETLKADIIGVVVNGVGSKQAGYYGRYGGRDGYYNSSYYRDGYGYSYGYSYDSGQYGEYYNDDQGVRRRRGEREKASES